GQAQQAMADRGSEADEARHDAAEEALAAIKQAQAEVEAQLADTRRRQKAVEVGELARAAEALERASAAEREIFRQAAQAALGNGLGAEQAGALVTEQAD